MKLAVAEHQLTKGTISDACGGSERPSATLRIPAMDAKTRGRYRVIAATVAPGNLQWQYDRYVVDLGVSDGKP